MEKIILIATSNEGKVREMVQAFDGLPVRLVSLSRIREVLPHAEEIAEPVEDGATFMENARIKAWYYREKTGLSSLADDSGLSVDLLGGAPGVYSARYAGVHGDDAANNAKLIAEIAARGMDHAPAAYHCALVLALEDGSELTAEGTCRGTIRPAARGSGGFGYDPHFYLADGRAMAELTREEKHEISHRGAALKIMKEELHSLISTAS
ncbi:RdgB/HAM1 family non-canonical purine NTP pyrophosphatase [uncultured Selenomonas sp.]|uniref:RdgB/HAM1 family non-canonical purine NTP pyrophosphatase n=1 Tax=uncultured Selenomonas sp. TaxID=159275 RepID=UPI0028D3F129|nr:RdgB/HAM1 family non-canonical purine NTP pyrophosphatase [uncultured Selenomonas sp.]